MKNADYKELTKMAQEALDELDIFEQTRNSKNVFEFIRRLAIPCFDGDSIKSTILDSIPLRERLDFSRAVYGMKSLNTLSGHQENMPIRSYILFFKQSVNELANLTKRNIGPFKIFYSWQSTLPGKANRNLIAASLTKAIDELNKELAVEDRNEASLDSDTANTPGSPDIIRTILKKVDTATIFIADITLINEKQPNSNVMFELGYAIKSLGEDNIILLFNEHYGNPRDLPFDLGLKRAMLYRCAPDDEDKSSVKKELAKKLKGAIDTILSEQAE